jgi:hypothetical protein
LNPLVALYFACANDDLQSRDGVVHVFTFKEGRVKFADSDAVSIICNLARLSMVEKQAIIASFKAQKASSAAGKDAFRMLPAMKRLTQFVRIEKPYFLDSAEPRDLFKYFFVHPAKSNRRLIAQSGAFIAAGLLEYKGIDQSLGFDVVRILVPASAKAKILNHLDAININSRTMFPEVEFASRYIMRKWRE